MLRSCPCALLTLHTALFLLHCARGARESIEEMKCDHNQPPLQRGILLTEAESLKLGCSICTFSCDADHGNCRFSPPFKEPISEDESWTVKLGLEPPKMKPKKKKSDDRSDKVPSVSMRRKRIKNRDRLYYLSRAKEFERLDSGTLVKKAKLESYIDSDPALIWTFQSSNGEAVRLSNTEDEQDTPIISSYVMSKDLLIFHSVEPKDEGIYDCYWRGVLRKRWAITIVPTGAEPFRFRSSPGRPRDRLLNHRRLPLANLFVFTEWSPWSDCSVCVLPGRKTKLGSGKTIYESPESSDKVGAIRVRIGICHVKVIHQGIPTRPVNAALLARYGNGLPCRSHLLPNVLKSLRAISYRPSEMHIERCTKNCTGSYFYWEKDSNIFTPIRFTGLERLRKKFNFGTRMGKFFFPGKTFESLRKIMPPKQPKRKLVLAKAGKSVNIICPYDGFRNTPFAWYKLNRSFQRDASLLMTDPLDFLTVHVESRGRIRFDSAFNLILASTIRDDNVKWVCLYDSKVTGYVYVAYMEQLNATRKAIFASKVVKVISPTLIVVCLIWVSTMALVKDPSRN